MNLCASIYSLRSKVSVDNFLLTNTEFVLNHQHLFLIGGIVIVLFRWTKRTDESRKRKKLALMLLCGGKELHKQTRLHGDGDGEVVENHSRMEQWVPCLGFFCLSTRASVSKDTHMQPA
jgi:hypothetical protein